MKLIHQQVFMSLFFLFLVFKIAKSQASFKGSLDVANGILVYANFFPFPNHKLNSTPVESRSVRSEEDCIAACTEASRCRSLNFKTVPDANNKFICHLLDTDKFHSSELFNASLDFHHYSFTAPCELSPCKNGGACYPAANSEYDFKCTCVASFRGKRCDKRFKSCAELLDAGYNKNGVYQILLNQSEVMDVYCDQSSRGGGWTMVFKVVSGVSADIYQLWSSSDSLNENKTEALNVNSTFRGHYKNRLVPNWQNPKEARVALYKSESESEILSIVFNATNSSSTDWFAKDRLTHSPWTDLHTRTKPLLFFTIEGCCGGRTFYIVREHGGCSNDAGWLLVTGQDCPYEKRYPKTTVMYSNRSTYTNWNKYENVDIADSLVVYIR